MSQDPDRLDPQQLDYTSASTPKAEREEKLFRRFKVEESSQSITAKRRMVSPEDNNERQQIHDHDSVILVPAAAPKTMPANVTKKSAPAGTSLTGGSE